MITMIEIKYIWDVEFTKEELDFLSSLSARKEILDKIINKMIKKLTIDMLNKKTTPEFIEWFERAMVVLKNTFKN